jgi:hypothetical protein
MSPVKPENRGRYPANWSEISTAVKQRAAWRCECVGECGGYHPSPCGRRHGETIHQWDGKPYPVVLTTAHLDHTPENCDPQNLKAMCQACHLGYDRDHHAQTRAAALRRDAEAAGQGLLEVTT